MEKQNSGDDEAVDGGLGDIADSQESDDSLVNSDLHGQAREVAEDASGEGAAKTPGG